MVKGKFAITALRRRPFDPACLLAQPGFYATSLPAALAQARLRSPKVLRLTTMFAGMSAALLVGFRRRASGRQGGAWRRTARVGGSDGDAR